MSRHRNVRSLNYSDECEGYDDVYGHSVEDDYSISPSVAEQFMYDRSREAQMSAFFREEAGIAEEDENVNDETVPSRRPQLSEVDEARLQSCLDEIRNVVGDSAPEHVLVNTILRCGFDIHRALDQVLNSTAETKAGTLSQKDASHNKDFFISNSSEVLSKKIKKLHVSSPQKNTENFACSDTKTLLLSTEPTAGSLFGLMSKNNNDTVLVSKDQINEPPVEGSLFSLMAKHKNSEPENCPLSSEGSLFSLMAKHQNSVPNAVPPSINSKDALCDTIPSLFSLMSNHQKSRDNKDTNFTSFADLSAHHLKSIPSNAGTELFPNFDFPPKENLQPIDLTCAIKMNIDEPEDVKVVRKKSTPKKKSISRSVLIPCDSNFKPLEQLTFEKYPPMMSREPSQLGKVLCRCWSNRYVPYIDTNPVPKTVNYFGFNTPSPDDLISKALKQNKH